MRQSSRLSPAIGLRGNRFVMKPRRNPDAHSSLRLLIVINNRLPACLIDWCLVNCSSTNITLVCNSRLICMVSGATWCWDEVLHETASDLTDRGPTHHWCRSNPKIHSSTPAGQHIRSGPNQTTRTTVGEAAIRELRVSEDKYEFLWLNELVSSKLLPGTDEASRSRCWPGCYRWCDSANCCPRIFSIYQLLLLHHSQRLTYDGSASDVGVYLKSSSVFSGSDLTAVTLS